MLYWIYSNSETFGAVITSILLIRFFVYFIVVNEETRDKASKAIYRTNFEGMLYMLQSLFFLYPIEKDKHRSLIILLNILGIINWILIILLIVIGIGMQFKP